MAEYVDGYVLPVPKSKVKAYQKMAAEAGKMWMKYGALSYMECVADDLHSAAKFGCMPFPKMVKNKSNETILFSFAIYKSRKHRDAVNKRVHLEMLKVKDQYKDMPMPFNPKTMAFGGFKPIVNYQKKK